MNKKSTIIIIFMVLLPMVLSASSGPCLKKSIIANQSMCNLESTSVSYFEDDSWSMFRHDPEHSGCSPSSAPETDTVLWSFIPKPYNWLAESSPAIVDNKVYIGGCCSIGPVPIYGRVYCLDGRKSGIIKQMDGCYLLLLFMKIRFMLVHFSLIKFIV